MSGHSEVVHLPALISIAMPGVSRSSARLKICHGGVYVNDECIGLPDVDIPREKLRGARVRVGAQEFTINDLGTAIKRPPIESPEPDRGAML